MGYSEVIGTWTDPDFDPKTPAAYYARVIEIPTPRWTAYDAKRFGIKMDDNAPVTSQERGVDQFEKTLRGALRAPIFPLMCSRMAPGRERWFS